MDKKYTTTLSRCVQFYICTHTHSCICNNDWLYSYTYMYYRFWFKFLWWGIIMMWVFHLSINWRFFIGIWVTASLLVSSGLFSVFWLILTMFCSVGSQFFLWFPIHLLSNPMGTIPSSPTISDIAAALMFHVFFKVLRQGPCICLSFCLSSQLGLANTLTAER